MKQSSTFRLHFMPSATRCFAGMVLTDLLLRDANPVARRFFNTLAEEPETVAAAIVPQIRAVQVGLWCCEAHVGLLLQLWQSSRCQPGDGESMSN
jgi:hypothetical protein